MTPSIPSISVTLSSDSCFSELLLFLAPLLPSSVALGLSHKVVNTSSNPPSLLDLGTEPSSTLHSLSLWPSATFSVLPLGAPLSHATSAVHDSLRNDAAISHASVGPVVTSTTHDTTGRLLAPSQIMSNIASRATKAPDMTNKEMPAAAPSVLAAQAAARRLASLDSRLATASAANAKSKKKKTTGKVLQMLMKSRATCPLKVEPQDRLHFKVSVVDETDSGDTITEAYMFFSRTHSVGRLCDLACPVLSDQHKLEAVIKVGADYRRLPSLKQLFELVRENVLEEFGEIVVRQLPLDQDSTQVI